jgi:hypothetical protein
MTSHFGPYTELGPAHEAVRHWCNRNGHSLRSPFWEIMAIGTTIHRSFARTSFI